MSSYELTTTNGERYRIDVGNGIDHTPDANGLAPAAQIERLILSLSVDELLKIVQTFYKGPFASHLESLWRARKGVLSTTTPLPRGIELLPADPQHILLEASANGELQFQAIESESTSADTTEDRRNILRVKIYQSLNEIIAAEQAEYARLDAIYQQESTLNKGLIQTGAVLTGLGQSAWGLAVWLKDVTDLVNPVVHTRQLYQAGQTAIATGSLEQGALTLHKAQMRELVEVLGFDPTQISREQIDRAMESAELIWEDPALQSALFKFAKDYANAQHSTEISHMAGAGVFEIILTVILVALTGGAGAVANMASKARLLGKFDKLGKLLLEFADAAKAIRLAQKNKGAKANKGKSSLADLDADDVSVNTPSEPPAGTKDGGVGVPNNTNIISSTIGKNNVQWKTDANGLPLESSGSLGEYFKGAKRGSAEVKAQVAAGQRGLTDDHGGHLAAHRFVLDQGDKNLFPQNKHFNNSAFKTLENDYARYIDQGNTVEFKHVLGDFDSTGRPGTLSVQYDVIDKNGNLVFDYFNTFNNQAGEVYKRTAR